MRIGCLALALIVSTPAASTADAIRYNYGGVITWADPSTGMSEGTRFSGSFTYDPAGPAAGMHFEGYHDYSFGRSDAWPGFGTTDGSGLSLDAGGRSLYSHQGGLDLLMQGDEPSIGYPRGTGTRVTIGNSGVDFRDPLGISLNLSNADRVVYPTLAPPSSLRLDDFPSAELTVHRLEGNGYVKETLIRGTIDTLSLPSPAPEPSALALFALGGAGWLARSALRRRR